MVQDLDIKSFLSNLKATKPPYVCPFDGCGKIYKTYAGMKTHLYQWDHIADQQLCPGQTPDSARKRSNFRGAGGRSPSPPDFLKNNKEHVLTYAEAQRLVEVDIDGKMHRININEPLDIVQLDEIDADDSLLNGTVTSLNTSIAVPDSTAKNKKSSESQPMTPTGGKNKKTGKGKTGKGKSGKGGKGRKDAKSKEVQVEKPSVPAVLKLPEPSFRVIEGYDPPNAKPRSSSYYRYIEKTIDDVDEEIEYDMDEEDTAWLELINKKRKEERVPEVPADTFELLMDRLEKESYFQSQNSGKDIGPAIDEDAVCCICNDGECQNSNAILFCDMCNLAVHQECYGVPYIPEGQWLCRRCLQSPSRAVDCVLCPNKGGAFKQTDDNRWAHVVCALWIPEVCFANTVFLEPIDSIGNIPSARWKLSCYICKQKNGGACIQCHKANCYVAFHVTCAQQAGLYMKMEAVRELTSSGVITNVKKAAYCDAHTPTDENGVVLSGVYSSGDEDSRSDNQKVRQTKAKFKEKMKKARKILAEKRQAIPAVSIPTIPLERLTRIAALVTIPKRNMFLQRLLGYWTLKRQSRNGVPLLRRLQVSNSSQRKDGPKEGDNEQMTKVKEHFRNLNRLRQDLERVRLLVELIRKREKFKREKISNHQQLIEVQLNPYKMFLLELLSKLEEKDTNGFFVEPVSSEDVPDYLDFIHNPMDFSTMKAKIERNEYNSFDMFVRDFNLVVNNCKEYNEKETIWHKAAAKLHDQCEPIIREARKLSEGYNTRTGLHIETTANDLQLPTLVNSVAVPETVSPEQQKLEEKLRELEDDLTKERLKKSGGSRTKRVRSLTAEIANVKSQLKSTNFSAGGHSSVSFHLNSIEPILPNSCLDTNATINRNTSPNKKKKSPNKAVKNQKNYNDSDATDICENNNNLNNFIDKFEGRKTHNSVSATINSEIDELISSSPKKQNSVNNHKESPKRSKKINDKTPQKKVRSKKNKLNGGSPLSAGSVSPNSFRSSPSALNSNFGFADKTSSLRKKGPNGQKVNSKSMTNSSQLESNMFTETAESFAREQAVRGTKRRSNQSSRPNKRQNTNSLHSDVSQNSIPLPVMPQKESFSVYRNAVSSPVVSDLASESCQSNSSTATSSSCDSSGSSQSHSSVSSMTSGTSSRVSGARNKRESRRPRSRSSRSDMSPIENHKIPLQPNDLVWAKCQGFPWYPALIVNPDEDLSANGIPVPPQNVIQMREKAERNNDYLVTFFDQKRTWQWLPRDKLEPLSIDSQIDEQKKNESRKPTERKAVHKAYDKALEFYQRLKNL